MAYIHVLSEPLSLIMQYLNWTSQTKARTTNLLVERNTNTTDDQSCFLPVAGFINLCHGQQTNLGMSFSVSDITETTPFVLGILITESEAISNVLAKDLCRLLWKMNCLHSERTSLPNHHRHTPKTISHI